MADKGDTEFKELQTGFKGWQCVRGPSGRGAVRRSGSAHRTFCEDRSVLYPCYALLATGHLSLLWSPWHVATATEEPTF